MRKPYKSSTPTNLIQTKNLVVKEQKSYDKWGDTYCGYGYAMSKGWVRLGATLAWRYYKENSVVAHGVDMISDAFSVIQPKIWDSKEKEWITEVQRSIPETQVLELFKEPNSNVSGSYFRGQCAKSYPVTGDMYVYATSIAGGEPKEIFYVSAADINRIPDSQHGGVREYQILSSSGSLSFKRDDSGGRTRYIADNGVSEWELWSTKRFNPDESSNSTNGLCGFSKLNPVYFELDQLIQASLHNSSTLKRGANVDMAIMIDKDVSLTEEQFLRLERQAKEFQGADSKRIFVAEGGKSIQSLTTSMKDLQFIDGIKLNKEQVYNNLNIPLAKVSTETMTLDNLKIADVMFYRDAVLPFSTIFYDEMNRFLMPRFNKNWDGRYSLGIDQKDIKALEPYIVSMIKDKIDTGMYTINEGRALLDLINIGPDGDIFYIESSQIPIGTTPEPEPEPEAKASVTSEIRKHYMDKIIAKVEG